MGTDKYGERLPPCGGYRRIADKAGFRAFIRRAETSFPSVHIRTIPYKSVLVANEPLLPAVIDRAGKNGLDDL